MGDQKKLIIRKDNKSSFLLEKRGILVEEFGFYFWPQWSYENILVDYFTASEVCNPNTKTKVISNKLRIILQEKFEEESNPVLCLFFTSEI